MGKSKTLGILSIFIGPILPIIGVTIATIGLSISKSKEERDGAIALNIIGIAVSYISYMLFSLILPPLI